MGHKPDRPLKMDVRREGCAAVVVVHGSAGMNEAEKMRLVLQDLAAQKRTPIVLDLSDMDFICSEGLGAIICGYLKSRHHNGRIGLVNPQPMVCELLEATRLTRLLDVFSTVEQALAR